MFLRRIFLRKVLTPWRLSAFKVEKSKNLKEIFAKNCCSNFFLIALFMWHVLNERFHRESSLDLHILWLSQLLSSLRSARFYVICIRPGIFRVPQNMFSTLRISEIYYLQSYIYSCPYTQRTRRTKPKERQQESIFGTARMLNFGNSFRGSAKEKLFADVHQTLFYDNIIFNKFFLYFNVGFGSSNDDRTLLTSNLIVSCFPDSCRPCGIVEISAYYVWR